MSQLRCLQRSTISECRASRISLKIRHTSNYSTFSISSPGPRRCTQVLPRSAQIYHPWPRPNNTIFKSLTTHRPASTSSTLSNTANLPPSTTPITELQTEQIAIANPTADFTPVDSFDSLLGDPVDITPHIGYLEELGLDYGWGPTSFAQWLMEHIWVYSGVSWGGAIIGTSLVVRLILVKYVKDANDMGQRMRAVKPLTDGFLKQMQQGRVQGDRTMVMKAARERSKVHKANGIQFYKVILPIIQVPLGFGIFRLLRGMSTLPVPGFEESGLYWFSDLTMPDPYGLLPLATAAMYHLSFRAMATSGEADMSTAMITIFSYGLPILSLAFGVFFPAGLQLTLFVSAIFTVSQSVAFRMPRVRNFLGMYPVVQAASRKGAQSSTTGNTIDVSSRTRKPGAPNPEEKQVGFAAFTQTFRQAYSDIQSRMADMQGKSNQQSSNRLSPAEKRRAEEYERKRQKETAQRRR